MPLAPLQVGNVIQTIHYYSVDDQTCMNVMYYVIEDLPTVGAEDYTEGLRAWNQVLIDDAADLVQGWRGMSTTDCTSRFLQSQRISPARGPYVRTITGLAGTRTAPNAPSAVALSLSKRTEAVGRGRTGHMQLGGLDAAWMSNGRWSEDAMEGAQTMATSMEQLKSWLTDGTMYPVVWSNTGSGSFEYITSIVPHDEIRTMRRRAVGQGI